MAVEYVRLVVLQIFEWRQSGLYNCRSLGSQGVALFRWRWTHFFCAP